MQQILKQINITIIQMASFIRLIQLWDKVEMTATNMFATKQAERLTQLMRIVCSTPCSHLQVEQHIKIWLNWMKAEMISICGKLCFMDMEVLDGDIHSMGTM